MNRTEHLLVCVSEECAEIAKAADKALRFGLGNKCEESGSITTNAQDIIKEFHDLIAVLEMLAEDGALEYWDNGGAIIEAVRQKKEKVSKYMDYSRLQGTLKD